MKDIEVDILVGKVLTSCFLEDEYEDEVHFITTENEHFKLFHNQDCCESVYIEELIGDLNDLVGEPLIEAEEVSTDFDETEDKDEEWTFYKFRTRKGMVTIRWVVWRKPRAYSTSVSFRKVV